MHLLAPALVHHSNDPGQANRTTLRGVGRPGDQSVSGTSL